MIWNIRDLKIEEYWVENSQSNTERARRSIVARAHTLIHVSNVALATFYLKYILEIARKSACRYGLSQISPPWKPPLSVRTVYNIIFLIKSIPDILRWEISSWLPQRRRRLCFPSGQKEKSDSNDLKIFISDIWIHILEPKSKSQNLEKEGGRYP